MLPRLCLTAIGVSAMCLAQSASTADWAVTIARFDRERGEIWFLSRDNGLQIVRFTDRLRMARRDLLGSR